MNLKNIVIGLVVLVGIFLGTYFPRPTSAPLGKELTDVQNFNGGARIGEFGTAFAHVKTGTCSILANASVSATSTKNFDCAFDGVKAGDKVFVHQVASSTLASQYVIKGYVASSTDGYITFSILNLTGGAAVPAATNGFGSSTEVSVFRAL